MNTFNVLLGVLSAGADFCVLVTEHTLKVFFDIVDSYFKYIHILNTFVKKKFFSIWMNL